MNRGVARKHSGDPAGAGSDYDAAIALREGLRQRLGADWPPQWANDLALVYTNRGIARRAGQDLSGALADYGQAIELRETLRRRPGAEWPPSWANDLANAYMDRGILLKDTGCVEEAIAGWSRAAQIYLNLIERGQLQAGALLLKTVSWQFDGFRDLSDWPGSARCLLQFLNFYDALQTQWTPGGKSQNQKPLWLFIAAQFALMVHTLQSEQRVALLDALGEEAKRVKQLFGWQ